MSLAQHLVSIIIEKVLGSSGEVVASPVDMSRRLTAAERMVVRGAEERELLEAVVRDAKLSMQLTGD